MAGRQGAAEAGVARLVGDVILGRRVQVFGAGCNTGTVRMKSRQVSNT